VISMMLAHFGHRPVCSILNRFVPKNLQITSRSIRPRRDHGSSGNQQIRRISVLCRALFGIGEDRKQSEISHHTTPNGCRMVQAGRYVLRCGTTCKMMMEAASVGALFHFKPSVQCRLLALRGHCKMSLIGANRTCNALSKPTASARLDSRRSPADDYRNFR
jgi:hypothetical protein